MKHLKKLGSVLLALVMVLALAAPAFAAGANPGSITLKNPESTPDSATHTYNVYRVFDMTRGTGTGDNVAVSYTATTQLKDAIEADNSVNGFFAFTAASETGKFTVSATDAYDETAAKTFSGWLSSHTNLLRKVNDSEITLTGPGTAGSGTQTLEVPYGYYFVDSNVGSLFMLYSTNPNVTITDKNLDPTIEKDSSTPTNVKIGDEITYTITIKVVEGTDKEYVLHDKMGTGLALVENSIEVKVDSEDVNSNNYSFNEAEPADKCAFEVTFSADYLKTIPNKNIVVTYKATILDIAAIPEGAQVIQLDNEAKVKYGDNDETTPSTTTDKLYQFDLVKTDKDGNLLDTAEFELYSGDDVTTETDSEGKTTYTLNNGASPIEFVYDEATKIYKVSTATKANAKITVDGGKVTVQGLNGTFYLKETKSPDGYNLLTTLTKVDVTENNNATVNGEIYVSGGIRVQNNAGQELPSTGGIGTTIFYLVGGLCVAAAAVLLITKKRMGKPE